MTDATMVAVDGRDALCYVLVRPRAGSDNPADVSVEAFARGVAKSDMARILRYIADRWDREEAAEAPNEG